MNHAVTKSLGLACKKLKPCDILGIAADNPRLDQGGAERVRDF